MASSIVKPGGTPPKPAPSQKALPQPLPQPLPPVLAAALVDKLADGYPDAATELVYASPFELLVAVMLSAQATDVSVNKATAGLFAAAPTPQAMLALGFDGLLAHVRSIGLAPTKTRNILAACGLLLQTHGGDVPDTREALEALPGVGRKTANVVLNVAFGQPVIAVDTHIFRVANRTRLAPGKNPRQVEEGLLQIIPPRHLKKVHHTLILHGRYVCKARKPDCGGCGVRDECGWLEKGG